MALSNAQLLMLDNLIYANNADTNASYISDDLTVREIITAIENDGYNLNSCEMSSSEWKELIETIKKEPTLLDYTVTNYVNDTKNGMRAACFVDDKNSPTDVNVVFRGTSGDYEWHDNGTGGYLSDTKQQELAAYYIEELPEKYGNNMTVTGHSKGGNKAQYVTIVTDRVVKCVSFDGQGFSEEFLNKYAEEIEKKAQSIISISASKDFVNCLLYPIAGTRIYVEAEEQDKFIHWHKPNILMDENGNLKTQSEQSDLAKFINEYTTYMISNMDEPERTITIDGLIALLEKGESKEHILQTIYAGNVAISHLDDFAFDYIGENYGLSSELITTYIAALYCPHLFLDDLLNCGKEMVGSVIGEMLNFAEEVRKKLESFGKKASQYGKKFVEAITTYANKVNTWFNKTFNAGYKYATANTYIKVDTGKLRAYSDRLTKLNKRVYALDKRMDSLYTKVGLEDLWDFLQADALVGYSWRINRCISYLNDTATEFENAERSISSQF